MILGIFLTIILIIGIGLWSGRRATTAESFTTGGGKAGSWIVCGTIMGTIVSGQATIGTAQLAFSFGISAWWFTIGAALGCLVLSLLYARPLRRSHCTTLLEVVGNEYGRRAETLGSCLCLVGIFISIVAQIIASSALLTSLFPIGYMGAALIAVALMTFYVVFGGLWGAGMGGLVKMGLLYVSSIVAGLFVWRYSKCFGNLMNDITHLLTQAPLCDAGNLPNARTVHHQYGNLLARGPLKDIGSCLSLILGVLSTQTYAQGIWAGKSDRAARRGGLLCALLIPPIGAACTLVGMYMRAHYITTTELQALGNVLPANMGVIDSSVQAFPAFITHHLPGFFGGVVIGTLFITIVGGGSGLALGASTIVVRDVFKPIGHFLARVRTQENATTAAATTSLTIQRIIIVAILLLGVAVSFLLTGTFINDLGFLSLGLRATAVLVPLTCTLFFPKHIKPAYAFASMLAGTCTLLIAKFAVFPADPVYWGIGVALAVCLIGIKHHQ